MERLRLNKKAIIATTLLSLGATGCISSIETNDKVSQCDGRNTPVEATFEPDEAGYSRTTDPSVLADAMRRRAEKIQDDDGGIFSSNIYRNQIVGLGEVVCREEISGKDIYFLTAEGLDVGRSLS